MIIIIEGPDGAGKTTLAHKLATCLNLKYHHEGPPPVDIPPLDHYLGVLEKYRHCSVVIDRFALGERVYGPALRGGDRLGQDGFDAVSRRCLELNAHQIICLPPVDACLQAWMFSGKPELFDKHAQFFEAYARFAYFAFNLVQLYVYDWTIMSMDDLYYVMEVDEDEFAFQSR